MPSIDDLFPPAQRVVYGINPLMSVVCQIRFPTLLRIEAQPPVEFQERIRARLPIVERTTNPALQNIPQELLQAIGAQHGSTGYAFRSEDGMTTAGLLSDSLTMETGAYTKWEDFWGVCEAIIEALIDIYAPSFITRTGLRYQNALRRARLNAMDSPWSELLSSQVLGELANPAWADTVSDARHVIRCKDTQGDAVLMQHGFGQIEAENEQVYLIDFDFYREERIECTELSGIFARFNSRSGRAFRWSISDRLHALMGPVAI